MLFKVGDIVEATSRIVRVDRLADLKPGEKAKVFRIYQKDSESPQIIDLIKKDNWVFIDIVCFDDVPLRLYGEECNNAGPK